MVELCARLIGRTPDGEQLYPTYEDFKLNLKERFWKDADEQIKHAQWEKLRQVNFPDSEQFFQQFKELAYYAGVCDNEQVMIAQIKKATCKMSKNTIYSADGKVPILYKEWKAHLLQMDFNWHLKKVEGITPGCIQAPKVTTLQKGGQTLSTPKKKTATGTTFRGRGVPMDIDAAKAVAKCYQCGRSATSNVTAPTRWSHKKRHSAVATSTGTNIQRSKNRYCRQSRK